MGAPFFSSVRLQHQQASRCCLAGTYTQTDNTGAPHVVVVSQEFVRRFWKDEEPLGKQIRLDVVGATPGWSEIVGVVADVKTRSEGVRDGC